MFCSRARSCAALMTQKSCAVGMRNGKPGNHLKIGFIQFYGFVTIMKP